MKEKEENSSSVKRKQISVSSKLYKELSLRAVQNDTRLCDFVSNVLTSYLEFNSEDK